MLYTLNIISEYLHPHLLCSDPLEGQSWLCRSCPDFTLEPRSGRLLAPPILLPFNCPKMKLAENLGKGVLRPYDKAIDVDDETRADRMS